MRRGIIWLTSVIMSLLCISVGLAIIILCLFYTCTVAYLSAFALVSKYKKTEYLDPCCMSPRSIEGTLATVNCCESYCHYHSLPAGTLPRSVSATVIIIDMVSCLALLMWQSECSVLNMQLYQPGEELHHTQHRSWLFCGTIHSYYHVQGVPLTTVHHLLGLGFILHSVASNHTVAAILSFYSRRRWGGLLRMSRGAPQPPL